MSIHAWLLSIVGSIVGRVLFALGFSVVTVAGFEIAIGQLKSQLAWSANSMPYEVLGLFLLAGGGVALNMILGAITFRVTLWTIQKSVRILGVNAS